MVHRMMNKISVSKAWSKQTVTKSSKERAGPACNLFLLTFLWKKRTLQTNLGKSHPLRKAVLAVNVRFSPQEFQINPTKKSSKSSRSQKQHSVNSTHITSLYSICDHKITHRTHANKLTFCNLH